jgi:hypothetical protein
LRRAGSRRTLLDGQAQILDRACWRCQGVFREISGILHGKGIGSSLAITEAVSEHEDAFALGVEKVFRDATEEGRTQGLRRIGSIGRNETESVGALVRNSSRSGTREGRFKIPALRQR